MGRQEILALVGEAQLLLRSKEEEIIVVEKQIGDDNTLKNTWRRGQGETDKLIDSHKTKIRKLKLQRDQLKMLTNNLSSALEGKN